MYEAKGNGDMVVKLGSRFTFVQETTKTCKEGKTKTKRDTRVKYDGKEVCSFQTEGKYPFMVTVDGWESDNTMMAVCLAILMEAKSRNLISSMEATAFRMDVCSPLEDVMDLIAFRIEAEKEGDNQQSADTQ